MNAITGQSKKIAFIVIGMCVFSFLILYYLKPDDDRVYVEAYNCVDYELNKINGDTDFDQHIETAFDECSAEIHRLTKSIYQEIIEDGKSNYLSTNIDYYFYEATGYFIFGMDEIVEETMKNTIHEELKRKFPE